MKFASSSVLVFLASVVSSAQADPAVQIVPYPNFTSHVVAIVAKQPKARLVAKTRHEGDSCNHFSIDGGLYVLRKYPKKSENPFAPSAEFAYQASVSQTKKMCPDDTVVHVDLVSQPFELKLGKLGDEYLATILVPRGFELSVAPADDPR